MNIIERQLVEKQVVTQLITVAKAAGWLVSSVHDGEESSVPATIDEAIDTVFSVDESWIHFTKIYPGEKRVRQTVFIVLGNDGWDCMADNSEHVDFVREVIDPMTVFTDAIEARLITKIA